MILVSVLGDFYSSVLPIFFEFKDKVTKHILVYDDFKKDVKKANHIKEGFEAFKEKYNYKIEMLSYVVDEDSMDALVRCSDFILSQSEDPKEIYINATDGLSSVVMILNHILLKKGINFLAYDMYDNQYNLLTSASLQKFDVKNILNISDHFILKGFGVKKSNIKEFADNYEKQIKILFEKNYKNFNDFMRIGLSNSSSIKNQILHKKVKKILVSMKLGSRKVNDPIITGTIFEAYVYNLLKKLDFDDIEIGFKVFQTYRNSKIINEFDILIMKNNHLHMLECKFKNSVKSEELVYKYIALSNLIDEDGKMMIVTKKRPNYDIDIDSQPDKGRVYKRGLLNNIHFTGAVQNNPKRFVFCVKELLRL